MIGYGFTTKIKGRQKMSRYEHIDLDISTATCATILAALEDHPALHTEAGAELTNFVNELRARLQRTDIDAHCPLNLTDEELLK